MKKKKIRIYGKLCDLLKESRPTRVNLLFVMGTLKHKMNLDDSQIDRVINHFNAWDSYTKHKADEYLKRKPKKRDIFFSSSNNGSVKKWQLFKGWARTVANNEIALDLDSKEIFERAVTLFDKYELKGNCRTWEGAQGGHVSLFFSQPVTKALKETVRDFFKGDPGQINTTCEGLPHQKKGNIVTVIKKRDGLNSFGSITKVIDLEDSYDNMGITDELFLRSIKSCYGKSEKDMALENDVVDKWKNKLSDIEVFDRLDFHKSRGDILNPTTGYWIVLA